MFSVDIWQFSPIPLTGVETRRFGLLWQDVPRLENLGFWDASWSNRRLIEIQNSSCLIGLQLVLVVW